MNDAPPGSDTLRLTAGDRALCFGSPTAHLALTAVTTDQMIEVDRRMIEDVRLSFFQMMENTGLQIANVARDLFLNGSVAGKRVAVLAGDRRPCRRRDRSCASVGQLRCHR